MPIDESGLQTCELYTSEKPWSIMSREHEYFSTHRNNRIGEVVGCEMRGRHQGRLAQHVDLTGDQIAEET